MRDEAEARRKRPANRWGCKPIEDVCVAHDDQLMCPHGCREVRAHQCKINDAFDLGHTSLEEDIKLLKKRAQALLDAWDNLEDLLGGPGRLRGPAGVQVSVAAGALRKLLK